jgi:hypothetical protein
VTPTATSTPTATPPAMCTPTPTSGEAPATPPGNRSGFSPAGGGVDSVTISPRSQEVLAAAVGPRGTSAVSVLQDGMIWIGLSVGHTQRVFRSAGPGQTVAMAYSAAGRLHLVIEHDGSLVYRRAEPGDNPGDAAPEVIGGGGRPAIAVDRAGWAHIFSVAAGTVYHIEQTAAGWRTTPVAAGESATAVATENSLIIAARSNGTTRIYRRGVGGWSQQAQFAGAGISAPRLDAHNDWVVAAWVTEELDPDPDQYPRRRPEYKPAAPFVNRIYAGENAQQWFTSYGRHDGGVRQTFATSAGAPLTAHGTFMAWSSNSDAGMGGPNDANPPSIDPAQMNAQICLDPTGGVDIYSNAVVCSAPNNSLDTWTAVAVSTVAQASTATIFLRSAPDLPVKHNNVYWDEVSVTGAAVTNDGFEGDYQPWNGIAELQVAGGWAPFFIEDPPEGTSSGRYVVWATWSDNGGAGWSEPAAVARNAVAGRSQTGALGSQVYPVVYAGEPFPSLSFIFLFPEGDPAVDLGSVRYGRPRITICDLYLENCRPGAALSGNALILHALNQPARRLVAGVDPFSKSQAVIAWDAWQSDLAGLDVFVTGLAPAELGNR